MPKLSKYFLTIFLSLGLAGCGVGDIASSSRGDSSNSADTNDSFNDNSVNLGGGADVGDGFSEGNPLCDDVFTLDGPGINFLWKPVGDDEEVNPGAVVLFPPEFGRKFIDVAIIRKDGDVELGTFVGFTNGKRQTWRFKDSGEFYEGRVTGIEASQECTWLFPDPSLRQD